MKPTPQSVRSAHSAVAVLVAGLLLLAACGDSGSASTSADGGTGADGAAGLPPVDYGPEPIATSDAASVAGDPLPMLTDGDDPAVGSPAPTATGVSFDGKAVTIEGGPTAIVFLAHWCPHCQAEVAELTEYLASNDLPAGVDVVGVSTLVDEGRDNYPPAAWLGGAGWPFPVLVDDADSLMAAVYGLSATPFWVFVDAAGNVAERHAGNLSPADLAVKMEALAS